MTGSLKILLIGIVLLTAGATVDGVLEGYAFDARKSFERKWGVDPYGFWGSQSWRMVYKNGNPEDGFKSFLHKKVGALDFYHIADDARKLCYIIGGVCVGIGVSIKKGNRCVRTAFWYCVAILVITSIAKSLGMWWVRS